MRRRVVVVVVALALVVLAGGAYLLWQDLDESEYESAVATMPASTLRATFTDWASVRASQDGTALDSASSRADVEDFVDRAYRADLVGTSAVYGSTYAMAQRYGFSALDASWEMFGQSREGAVVVLRLSEDVDLPGIERNLRSLGYQPPADGAGSGQVWSASTDQVAQIDPSLTPVMENVVVLEDEGVVLLSDHPGYAGSSADVVRGDGASLASEGPSGSDGMEGLAELAEEPVTATMWASDFACEELSMASADQEDQAVASDLVSAAGGVNPLSGLVMAQQSDRRLVVGMAFESDEQAESNLRPRAELASGEAVGQGGSFADRFAVSSARQTGPHVVLELTPRDDSSLLADLAHGPVLFATC